MDLIAIRQRLAQQIRDNTGLHVYDLPSPITSTPAVLFGAVSGDYDPTLGSAGAILNWPLLVVVPQNHDDALSQLHEVLGSTEDTSLRAAIDESSPAPDADWWRLRNWEPLADIELDGTPYFTATVNVEIHAH